MEYHLEKQIRLNDKPKLDSLYPWCLEEIDCIDEKTGTDWIPWIWRLYFSVSELRLNQGFSLDHEQDKIQGFEESKVITGNLHPGICNEGKYLQDNPWFSMLGTDREITNFGIRIHAICNNENDYCNIEGFISYTDEIDYHKETEPDYIVINLGLSEIKFNQLADLISNKMIDVATINMSRVSGFYSEWRPSNETYSIKVLAPDSNEQKIIIPEGCKVNPPRLSEVGEFGLYLITRCKINPKQNFETLNISKLFEEEEVFSEEEIQIDEHEDINKQLLTTIVQNQLEILKLRTPLWIIAVLLGAFVLLELI
jgi:hypothetical protein